MKTAHTPSKHAGIVWRTLAAAAAIVIVLMMTGSKCPASASTTTTVTTSASVPPAFRTDLMNVPPGPNTKDLMWQMLAAMVVILVLGVLAYVVVKRLLPKIGRTAGKRISVLETVYLQPKRALHLIQVGSRKLLIASSPEGLAKLDDVTDALVGDYAEAARQVEDEAKNAQKVSENGQDTAK